MIAIETDGCDGHIDMSLRLWSDSTELDPLVALLGARCDMVHVRGLPLPSNGRPAGGIARRHYALLSNERGRNECDVEVWMTPLVVAIARRTELAALIASGHVEAIFWIALLGRVALPEPQIARRLLDEVAALKAAILIENYTDLATGNPRTSWLVGEPFS